LKRKKNTVTYEFRQSHMLAGLSVSVFENQFYPFGIKISPSQKWTGNSGSSRSSHTISGRQAPLLILNARNEHDREKFVDDLRESIAEMDEMERLRIDGELEKQRLSVVSTSSSSHGPPVLKTPVATSSRSTSVLTGRDSGNGGDHDGQVVLRKSAINNSLLDLTDSTGAADKMARRGSVGSLDSGMSVSFSHHNTSSTAAAANGSHGLTHHSGHGVHHQGGHCYHHHYHHHYMAAHHSSHIRHQPSDQPNHESTNNMGRPTNHLNPNRQYR